MSRTSMADLIARVRTLISDTGGSPQFTDDQVQGALDATRETWDFLLLEAHPTFHNGSDTTYSVFTSPVGGGWESDYKLYDSDWELVVPTASEAVDQGRFERDAANTDRFLYICGKRYDLYDAAAELCETWASALKLQYDLQSGSGVLGRHRSDLSEKYRQTLATAQLMRSRARIRSVYTVRRDVMPGM